MKLTRKLGILLLVMTVFLTTVFSFDLTTWAKKQPYMKEADVRWNLKPDKEISFKTYFTGYEYITVKAKLTDFKIENLEDGYRSLSFKVNYQFPKLKLSKKQVDRIIKKGNEFRFMWTFLDYDSGLSVEGKNDKDVMVEYGDWEHSDDVFKYKGNKGNWISYRKSSVKEINVTYPKDYKGLCLMVGGSVNPQNPYDGFFNGKYKLKKTPFYKKGMKNLSSFMRVKDFDK